MLDDRGNLPKSKAGPRPRRRVTSYDVARHAGVSQSAVSRCFKPGASVSKAMRARITKSIKALGYQPNAIARGLITRRSNMVGVIVSNLSFYPEVLTQLSARFNERGVRVLLFSLSRESDVNQMLEQIWQYQVDGVVAATQLESRQIRQFEERGVPLLFYNRYYQDLPVSSVSCDQPASEQLLVNLLMKGSHHESFVVISGPSDSVISLQRTQSAIEQLKRLGVKDIVRSAGDYTYESGRRAVRQLVSQKTPIPDAVICANDMMAIGCMDELRHGLNLDVPDDVSVVGFDGIQAASWPSYDLTTIQQPVKSMTEAAAAMLLERVGNHQLPPEKRMFSGILRKGATIRL